MVKDFDKLTPKQKAFIDFYIQTGNQTESARRSGYKHPNVQGNQLYVRLKEYIIQSKEAMKDNRIAGMNEIIAFWTEIIRDDSIDIKVRMKASELCAKVQGAFSKQDDEEEMAPTKQVDFSSFSVEELRKIAEL